MHIKQFFLILFTALWLFSCGKSNTPAPGNNNNNGGNNNGGTDNDPNKGVTVGNTTTYKSYVVKTVGISTIRLATDANEKITAAEFFGGGNHIVVRAGNTNSMSFINTNNFEPTVGPYDNNTHQFLGSWSNANYPVAQGGGIDNGKMLDTTNSITIKLKGFDQSKTGYNQLNLVLCGAPYLQTIKDWVQYNLVYIYHDGTYPDAVRKNALYARLLTTPVTVRSVELAKPLSENPYIVKDVVISSLRTVTDAQNKTTLMEFGTNALGLLKLGNDASGDKKAGTILKTELVNGDKGQLTYSSQNDGFGTLYLPMFSNLFPTSFGPVPEAADSLSKVFVRVSGFDASKCGYNQLRFYLMLDPYDIKQGFEPRPIFNVLLQHDKKQSLADLKASIKTSGLYCYQLLND
ncbi:hypothetical protein [Mucilaginibacter celer]|uniref:DUF4270 family protein n=1 Tax=Mucilaginibacter celer TaxID=2305508 RepID=A0A494W0B7_9SPHI|nr:hypothetical protein [Mucilaginibacter celer]AYL96692.1 hypothetical protein HYN43_015910 [Mucilaginibacter celer]